MEKIKNFIVWGTIISLFFLTGCSMPGDAVSMDQKNEQTGAAQMNVQDPNKAMLDYIAGLGFDTQDYFIEDGEIVVEGDIAFNIDAIQSAMEGAQSRQYAHVYLVRQTKVSSVTIRTSGTIAANWNTALTQAINRWNAVNNCKIRLTLVASTSSADITITNKSTTEGYIAKASFPDGSGNPGPTINFNTAYNSMTSAAHLKVMVHEIGHCLGMRHTNKTESDRILIPGTPISDAGSVMNQGTDPNMASWAGFSANDINAFQYVYPSAGAYIVVYENSNYTGKRWIIHQGQAQSAVSTFAFNDIMSSVKCFGGAKVTLYEHSNYGGRSITINQDNPNLNDNSFNDIASSIAWNVPTGPYAILYEHSGYKGKTLTVTGAVANLSNNAFNDIASSVKLFNGAKITLYQHSNYSGTSRYFTSNVYDFGASTIGFNDIASSLKF